MATVNGTTNNDVLFIEKGKSNDTLLGLAGNDTLDATTGAPTFCVVEMVMMNFMLTRMINSLGMLAMTNFTRMVMVETH
jgi:Ca2+-binding RTX toxin-like protein